MFGYGYVGQVATNRALRNAGFALAHAAYSVCEIKETLTPFALIHESGIFGGKTHLRRFVSPTFESSVAAAKSEISAHKSELACWSLAYESFFHHEGRKSDALTVDVGDTKMTVPFKIIQLFQPFSTGSFRLVGLPIYIIDGVTPDAERVFKFTRYLRKGVNSHPKAPEHWQRWESSW